MDELEQKVAALSAKVDALFLGTRIFLFLLLLLASFLDLKTTFSIPYFQRIFSDALPGMPLPGLTMLAIDLKSLLDVLVFVWPVMGFAAVCLGRRMVLSLTLLAVALICTVAQTTLISTAMFMPMTLMMTGMASPATH